jgi:hypothetical protein
VQETKDGSNKKIAESRNSRALATDLCSNIDARVLLVYCSARIEAFCR